MENDILSVLKQKGKALDASEIVNALFDNATTAQCGEISRKLTNLQNEKLIRTGKKGKFLINENIVEGKLDIKNDNQFGFIINKDGDDAFIHHTNYNHANNGDLVRATTFLNKKNNKIEGEIIKILEKNNPSLIGEIYFENNKPKVKLDNDSLDYKIELINYPMNLVEGLKVELKKVKEIKPNSFQMEIQSMLGHKNAPGTDITVECHEHKIRTEFPDEVLEEAKNIPGIVTEEEIQKEDRKDLREKMIFTIDGDDTKDIDDAVSIEIMKDGNIKLGVHIADVTNYVKENSEIYKEAYLRGNSNYLADRVIPMLPVELSNGICSLNPEVDRFAMTCEMTFTPDGQRISEECFESIIHSKKQMTYSSVNKILNGENVESYEEYKDTLIKMNELSTAIRKQMIKRGYIDFDTKESKLKVNDKGLITDVSVYDRGDAEKMIENFMIAANESVSEFITNLNFPCIYRIHDKPSPEKLNQVISLISRLGHKLTGKIDTENIRSKDIQKILGQLHEAKEYAVFANLMLRSMSKAEYSAENIGHFGLASLKYSHFTSPIRRFSDLTLHRILKACLKYDMSKIKRFENELPEIADQVSTTEKNSDDCERAVRKMKIAEYLENMLKEGKVFEATAIIDTVREKGFFCDTDNLIGGFVSTDTLPGKNYKFVEDLMMLTNGTNQFKIGDQVKVRCISASKAYRKIDFELIKE